MCWKTLAVALVVLLAAFFLSPSFTHDKEGFVTYIVYGPGGGWGSGYPQGGWPYGYRPYWGWRRRYWRGPCPGPWCPYW